MVLFSNKDGIAVYFWDYFFLWEDLNVKEF